MTRREAEYEENFRELLDLEHPEHYVLTDWRRGYITVSTNIFNRNRRSILKFTDYSVDREFLMFVAFLTKDFCRKSNMKLRKNVCNVSATAYLCRIKAFLFLTRITFLATLFRLISSNK
jgi:hypothetical protein